LYLSSSAVSGVGMPPVNIDRKMHSHARPVATSVFRPSFLPEVSASSYCRAALRRNKPWCRHRNG
jgi:hypothetical protein